MSNLASSLSSRMLEQLSSSCTLEQAALLALNLRPSFSFAAGPEAAFVVARVRVWQHLGGRQRLAKGREWPFWPFLVLFGPFLPHKRPL